MQDYLETNDLMLPFEQIKRISKRATAGVLVIIIFYPVNAVEQHVQLQGPAAEALLNAYRVWRDVLAMCKLKEVGGI